MDRELAKQYIALPSKHGPRAEQWAAEVLKYLFANVFTVEQLKQRISEEEAYAQGRR